MTKRYKTAKERDRLLIEQLLIKRAQEPLKSESLLILDTLLDVLEIVSVQTDRTTKIFVWNEEQGIFSDMENMIPSAITTCVIALNSKKSITPIMTDVLKMLQSNSSLVTERIQTYNPPPKHYILFENGCFDVMTAEKVDETLANTYHFVSKRALRFNVKMNPVYKTILDRIFDDWSEGQADMRLFLLQYLRAVLEGNSRSMGLIIQGKGGNGKSSFINMAKKLVGEEFVTNADLHMMDNTFNLEGLNSNTLLIAGDDLKSNFRFGGEALALAKKIIDGQTFTLNLKGKTPITVLPRCAVIQSTNTPLKFSETTAAVKDRFVYIKWPDTNYREAMRKGLVDFNLKQEIENKVFIENLISYIFDQTEPFEFFDIPQQALDLMQGKLKESDNVALFLEDLIENNIFDTNTTIPLVVLYQMYLQHMKEENPSAKPLAKQTFTERCVDILLKQQFQLSAKRQRISHLPYAAFNRTQFQQLYGFADDVSLRNNNGKSVQSKLFENKHNILKETDILHTREKLLSLTEPIQTLSDQEKRILCALLYDQKDAQLLSLFGEEIDFLY